MVVAVDVDVVDVADVVADIVADVVAGVDGIDVLPAPDGQSQDILRPDRFWRQCRSDGRVSPAMVKGRQSRVHQAQTSKYSRHHL